MNNENDKSGVNGGLIKALLFFCGFIMIISIIFITWFFDNRNGFNRYFADNYINFLFLAGTVFIICLTTFFYLVFEHKKLISRHKNIILLFAIMCVTIIACYTAGKLSLYARPVFLCGMLSLLLLNRRCAFFINFVMCLIIFFMDIFAFGVSVNTAYQPLIIGFSSGITAIIVLSGERNRLRVFLSGFIIAVPVIMGIVFSEAMTNGIIIGELGMLVFYGITSSFLSVVLFSALLPVFEIVFNIITNYRLMEITNHDSELIKRLRIEAMGTFNHSLMLASLSEACAIEIGENPLLARACAYYHDIGKLKNPEFFRENQMLENPHDELSPELSVQIIRQHTAEGAALLKKHRFPIEIIDSTREHHGTMLIKFFYAKALKMTDGTINASNFTYLGPKPKSKTTAIIMLADAAEALMRVITDRSHENIDRLVKELIEERIDERQFTDCDISIKELYQIKDVLVDNIAGMYHNRIEYPTIVKKNKKEKKSA